MLNDNSIVITLYSGSFCTECCRQSEAGLPEGGHICTISARVDQLFLIYRQYRHVPSLEPVQGVNIENTSCRLMAFLCNGAHLDWLFL